MTTRARLNFINFSFSALLGPVSLLTGVSAGGERKVVHYQAAFQPTLYRVALAILLTLLLRETGRARRPVALPEPPKAL